MHNVETSRLLAIVSWWGSETIKWERSGDQGNMWHLVRLNIENMNYDYIMGFTLIFEAQMNRTATRGSAIAIDDVAVGENFCASKYSVCTFESDMCGWSNALNGVDDDIDWIRDNGNVDKSETGPFVDHTKGTIQGWYVYIDAYEAIAGQKALLISEFFEPDKVSTQSCVRFYYNMFGGEGIGPLNVYSQESGVNKSRVLQWTEAGNKGNQWLYGEFGIVDILHEYFVVFEGVVGTGKGNDIALDDISISPSPCHASTGIIIPKTTTTTTTTVAQPTTTKSAQISHECPWGDMCLNGGTCFWDAELYMPKCICMPRFTGMYCENEVGKTTSPKPTRPMPTTPKKFDECPFEICQNGGTCVWFKDTQKYECKCKSMFSGINCEIQVKDFSDAEKNAGGLLKAKMCKNVKLSII